MNVNLYMKSGIQNDSATAIGAARYEQKNKEASSGGKQDKVEISQSGRLASAFDIDEDTANRIETAIQNADIPALLEEFKEKQGNLPVDEEWHYRKIVDPDGKIYSLTYVESLLRQYQCAENAIKAYYAKEHQDNLSRGGITDGMNYLSMKYTEFGLKMGSPYYRADMSEAERKMGWNRGAGITVIHFICLMRIKCVDSARMGWRHTRGKTGWTKKRRKRKRADREFE